MLKKERTDSTLITTDLLSLRLNEIEIRDKIVSALRAMKLSARSVKLTCERELGYSNLETRQILTTLGLIITGEALTSENPVVRLKIESLRSWRKQRAHRLGVPAYQVLTNRVLLAMASNPPKNSDELRHLKGFGEKRASTYGGEILSILGE